MSGSKRHPLRHWSGRERRYDLISEGAIAVVLVTVLCVVFAIIFGSPDAGLTYPKGPKSPPGTAFSARYWDVHDPADLATTVVGELEGTTTTAGYGPPFTQTGDSQEFIGIKPAVIAKDIFGLTLPINTAQDFVLGPVSRIAAPYSAAVRRAVAAYRAAGGDFAPGVPAALLTSAQQRTWLNNYTKALSAPGATITPTSVIVPAGSYGPVPVIVNAEMRAAYNGTLDGYLQGSPRQLSTNTSKSSMFFGDGQLWPQIAMGQGIEGSQWGVMNEVWNFPGQVWLWLYAGLYQVPALSPDTNSNLDLDVGLLMVLLGFLLPLLAPWIPGVNRVPRLIPLYKIAYRRYYAEARRSGRDSARHRAG